MAASMTMDVLAGLELGGASLTAFDDLEGGGRLGALVCGPRQLLRDLELRLGRGAEMDAEPVRLALWHSRVARQAKAGRFYSGSFAVDPLATARTLLFWRDGLVEAGWSGTAIVDGGPRLDALAELEVLDGPPVPAGSADRLRDVAHAVGRGPIRMYNEVQLSEPAAEWGPLWESIFGSLASGGTRVSTYLPSLPGADPTSDLGKVQSALAGHRSCEAVQLEADGSFVVLSAETSWEAARASAALCAAFPPEHSVVIRQDDVSALDHAFEGHGLPTQGWAPRSAGRAALQVLPLALELAFEPKDPGRVLELLTLPGGPFGGSAGRRLARAVSRSPGVGGPEWEREKAHITDAVDDEPGSVNRTLRERIETWLERPGAPPGEGAPVTSLLAIIDRVHAWLLTRIPRSPNDPTLLAAAHQAGTLRAALAPEAGESLDRLAVRRRLESLLGSGIAVRVLPEESARLDYVDRAEGLSVPRKNVIWWFFANGARSLSRSPWKRGERLAMHAAGLRFPDPSQRVTTRALLRRRAVLAATERLILVVPRSRQRQPVSVDPLWDEIIARAARSKPEALRAVQLDARELLSPHFQSELIEVPRRTRVAAVSLPGAHPEWTLGGGLPPRQHYSASSLAPLLACPLKWALQYYAGLRPGGHALPRAHQLNGTLGHRLIEVLHAAEAFALPEAQLMERACSVLDELIAREGASLLQPGMSFERSQLREQLVQAVGELARLLNANGATIQGVERPFSVQWQFGALTGRLDLLLRTREGAPAIVDLKWGASSYRDALAQGQALQLAVYAAAHRTADASLPEAAYFSLKSARLLALAPSAWGAADRVRGKALADTWHGIERSMERVEQAMAAGRFPVTGLRRSLPLLDSLGVPEDAQSQHYAGRPKDACQYCDFDAVCGRRWEGLDDH